MLVLTWLGTQQAQAAPAPTLTNDASGPLFPQLTMVPGQERVACIAVAYRDTDPGTSIGLYVGGVRGSLTDYLRVRVEVGAGGRHGDCTGFVGRDLYTGTLSGLSRQHGSAERALRGERLSGPSGTISYRLTLELTDDNRAQGRGARAEFTWVTPSAAAAAGGKAPTGKTTSTKAAIAPVPHGRTGAQLQGGPSGTEPPIASDEVVSNIAEVTKRALLALARGSAVSLLGLGLVMIFLAVHSRVDRRDQKLANAPLTPTFLTFDHSFSPRETS